MANTVPIASETYSSRPKLAAFGSGKLCYELYNFQSLGMRKEHSSFAIHFWHSQLGISPDGPSAAVSWCLPCRLPETCLNSFEKSIFEGWLEECFCAFFSVPGDFCLGLGCEPQCCLAASFRRVQLSWHKGLLPVPPSWFFWKWVEWVHAERRYQ